MLKNANNFENINCKIAAASGDPPLNTHWPRRVGNPLPKPRVIIPAYRCNFFDCITSVIRILLLRKITKVTKSECSASVSVALLRLFFTSNSAVFVHGGATIFLSPAAKYPSYATEKLEYYMFLIFNSQPANLKHFVDESYLCCCKYSFITICTFNFSCSKYK